MSAPCQANLVLLQWIVAWGSGAIPSESSTNTAAAWGASWELQVTTVQAFSPAYYWIRDGTKQRGHCMSSTRNAVTATIGKLPVHSTWEATEYFGGCVEQWHVASMGNRGSHTETRTSLHQRKLWTEFSVGSKTGEEDGGMVLLIMVITVLSVACV